MGENWIVEMSNRLDAINKTNDGEINTEEFLKAFEGHGPQVYPVLFGGEGMLSRQLSGDMDNNLSKIRRHYQANAQEYGTFDKMIAKEVEKQGKDKLLNEKDVAVKGVLWLNRTLDFICSIMESLSTKVVKLPSDIAKETYSKTLEPYHGWIARNTFSTALGWISDLPTIMKNLGFSSEEELNKAAKELAERLRPFITKIFALLTQHEVNFTYKV